MGSAGFVIAGIIALALVVAGVGFYLYQRRGDSDTARLFVPRARRLAFVERTSLEGGRKLLLVRRDNVEHLILVGGPIDVVVESGIRTEGVGRPVSKAAQADPIDVGPSWWPLADSESEAETVTPKAQSPFFPKIKEEERMPVQTPLQDVKAAE